MLYITLGLQVDNDLTQADIGAIQTLSLEQHCLGKTSTFDEQVHCLTQIQKAVQKIPETRCAFKKEWVEPPEFLGRNTGCCTDRARFIEKAARFYGFKTRHLFIMQPKYSFWLNFVPLGQESHATSEILTSKGWMGVDANQPVLFVQEGQPFTYQDLINNPDLHTFLQPHHFYRSQLNIIYGLYSRHGFFHKPKLPGPEYVFSELLYNFGS